MMVLFFARARDLAGTERVEIAGGMSVGELRHHLRRMYPKLAAVLEKSAFAINDDLADDAALIPGDAEVALLPPVSGG